MERKCAIYNRYSVNNEQKLRKYREELINYCENVLKINDYQIFEECKSVNEEREEFDKMMKLMDDKQFTDLVVCGMDRIYKPTYDKNKYLQFIHKIKDNNVTIHITDLKIIEPKIALDIEEMSVENTL